MRSEKLAAAAASLVFKCQLPWAVGATCIGVVLVLFPALFNAWRNEMEGWPKIYRVYEIFSNFKGFASIMFAAISIPLFVAALFGRYAYPGWDLKKNGRPTSSMVLKNKLYPKNWRGLIAFYSFLLIDLFAWLIPFFIVCLISHFIKH